MNLPTNARQLARSFTGLDTRTKDNLIAMLEAVPEDFRNNAIANIMARRTPREAAFVLHVLGKELPVDGASPENKSLAAPQRKVA